MPRRSRETPSVNASSMADIAFLLLTFFLVATSISQNKGISATLPKWKSDAPSVDKEIPEQNLLDIIVNKNDDILIEEEEAVIGSVRSKVIEFVTNEADSPQEAIISLKTDRGTSTKRFIEVYDQLVSAKNELWNSYSNQKFGRDYIRLAEEAKLQVRTAIPFIISEAKQTEF